MIHFTEHAKERMAQRNIREEIITENLEMFYRYGFWNDRGDRLTLNTKSEIIHNMIKMKQHMLLQDEAAHAFDSKAKATGTKTQVTK